MKIPPEYPQWLASLGFNEVSLGYGGLQLFLLDELDKCQTGYSKSPEGKSLCDGSPGSWKPEWIAIGNDTLVGDPIILDTASPTLQVTTAMHGEGSWEPNTIATSLGAFASALRVIQRCSERRENPVSLEHNPISSEERTQALNKIRAANDGEVDMAFWELLLEAEPG